MISAALCIATLVVRASAHEERGWTHTRADADLARDTVTASADDRAAPRTLDALLTRIRFILDSSGTPGASLAIVRGDSVLFADAIGRARLEPSTPATARTLFRIGSTSKLFIGLTALALEQENRLSLQQPLAAALPSYVVRNPWSARDTLRLVHLMEHTSGLDDNSLRAYASSDPTLTLEQGLAIDADRQRARWRPGTRFAYSNTGPALVARVIERIEGRPFEAIVQSRWFDRLGMHTATYVPPDTTKATLASLYMPGEDDPVPYWHVFARPIGAINASALDMAALLRFLIGRGVMGTDTLLPPGALDRAEQSRTWIGTRVGIGGAGYGLGLYSVEGADGRLWAGHAGGVEGGLSDVSYLPADGVGYSLQINAMRGRVLRMVGTLIQRFLTQDLPRPNALPIEAVSPVIAREFAGWYRPITPRPQFVAAVERLLGLTRVRVVGEQLRVEPLLGDAVRYFAVDSLRFRAERGSVVTLAFHRDAVDDGAPTMEGFNNGATFRRLGVLDTVATFGATAGWILALVLGPLVASVGVARWLIIALRRRQPDARRVPPRLAAAWGCAAGASGMAVLFGWCALRGLQHIAQLGTVTALSATVAATPLLFVVLVGVGSWFALRHPAAGTSTMGAVGVWTVRVVLALHVVGAVYAARYGLVGWRPWA